MSSTSWITAEAARKAAELSSLIRLASAPRRQPQDMSAVSLIRAVGRGGLSPDEMAEARDRGFNVDGPHRVMVDFEDLYAVVTAAGVGRRDLIVGTSTMGGYLVGDQVLGAVESLQRYGQVFAAGAQLRQAPAADASLAAITATGTATWLASEATAVTEQTPTIASRPMTPRNVAMLMNASRLLLLQSDAEALIARELLGVVGAAIDHAVLVGTGAPMPTGVAAMSGVGSADMGTASVAKLAAVLEAVELAKATPTAAFSHPATLKTLRSREVSSGGGRFLAEGNRLHGGLPVYSTPNVGTGTLIVGDFTGVTVGQWGALQVEADPSTHFRDGRVQFRLIASMDVAIPQPGMFCLGTGVS
jgi:HK97 family phage major capsid protein